MGFLQIVLPQNLCVAICLTMEFLWELCYSQDGDFSEQRFRNIVNANLANDIGNLLNRTVNLLYKYCEGTIPVSARDISMDSPLRGISQKKVSFQNLCCSCMMCLEDESSVCEKG